MKRLGPDDRFGVVALPCQAYAIRKLAEINSKYKTGLVFIIGLLCGGAPTYLGTRYLLDLYGFDLESLSRIEYRGGGWPGRLLLEGRNQENRRRVTRSYPEYWQGVTEYFFPFRCTICT
ncbi:Coenzyme F420 hydrogenase/dehydrogenase, beta subunit C-terminal domain, partial [bacterium]|nr:Coenzyme F420 hydrogenase/dehydrogenase, beta subunit C-terminal domain [bacterium]